MNATDITKLHSITLHTWEQVFKKIKNNFLSSSLCQFKDFEVTKAANKNRLCGYIWTAFSAHKIIITATEDDSSPTRHPLVQLHFHIK